MSLMAYEGVDLTVEAGQISTGISWHDPHPIFVIILVGVEEIPFGIQKDLLCAQSPYYRELFMRQGNANQVEYLVKLPNTDLTAFGCFQQFIYSGTLYDKSRGKEIPDYPLLMSVWKLATFLKMAPLRIAILDVMAERRQATSCIPNTPLLIQAWQETEEGSGLRKMLIGWAAEHMRTSPGIRNEFAKSLPQEILSELVVVMSDLPATLDVIGPAVPKPQLNTNTVAIGFEQAHSSNKRRRKSEEIAINGPTQEPVEAKPIVKKVLRHFESNRRNTNNRRTSHKSTDIVPMSPGVELDFCRDLITRMYKGPGFWTRYVGAFKFPVNPAVDNVPNYFDVVKRPMDLKTIHEKMNRGEYTSAIEFEADIRLIFQNCYEYWTQDDDIFKACVKFEDYFNKSWTERHRWPKTIKAEVID